LKLTFELPKPPALNRAYRAAVSRAGRPYTYKSSAAKRWQKDAAWLIISQRRDVETFTGKVAVHMRLYLNRDRDIDSSFKLLLDTLETSKVIVNDKQIVELSAVKHKDKRDIVEIDVIDLETT
jgi:Holliday junction resolvase RusA-like endonuclease